MKKLLLLLAIAAIACKKEAVKTDCDNIKDKGAIGLIRYSANPIAPKDTTGISTAHLKDSVAIILGAYGIYNDTSGELYRDWETDRKSTRLNSSHRSLSRMPSSA